uniref:Uncharacterized protein n=1 Tax=Aegilops tauschii subsp. strangulata TaxID=200361 RepID=A0A453T1F5_AEGTS
PSLSLSGTAQPTRRLFFPLPSVHPSTPPPREREAETRKAAAAASPKGRTANFGDGYGPLAGWRAEPSLPHLPRLRRSGTARGRRLRREFPRLVRGADLAGCGRWGGGSRGGAEGKGARRSRGGLPWGAASRSRSSGSRAGQVRSLALLVLHSCACYMP